MKIKLFLFSFIFFFLGILAISFHPQQTYACTQDSDCAQSEYCSIPFWYNCASLNNCGGALNCYMGASTSQPCVLTPWNHTCDTTQGAYYNCSCNSYGGRTFNGGFACQTGGQNCNTSTDCSGGQICDSGLCQCITNCMQQPNSTCVNGAKGCPSNYYSNSAYECDSSLFNGQAICCTVKPTCNTGLSCTGWSACGGYPANTCYAGNGSQSQTCTYTTYNNGSTPCNQASSTNTQSCTVNNCYANYSCQGGNCTTNIYIYVYTDYNHDGTKNGNDSGKAGVYISDGGGNNFPTNSSGNVTFTGKTTGNYTITETVPTNFYAVNGNSKGVSLTNSSGNATVNFYVSPYYNIAGRIFVDKNKDQRYDGSDTGYSGGTIHITGGPTAVADMTAAADGTWSTPTNLLSGTYTVAYTTALSGGYQFTTPSTYSVTVGDPAGSPVCNIGGSLDATCGGINNGSIANLNIGVTNEVAWRQSACFDVRNDGGTYTNPIPAAPSCGGVSGAYDSINNGSCATGAGIIFSCTATPNFGLGSANANNWQAGGATPNNECFIGAGLNVIRTSYNYLLTTARESNITPIDMATVCGAGGLTNCTLPSTLPKGVYQAQGNVNLNSFTFPVDPTTPQGFIFLINGDLHLMGNIIIPAGSVGAFSTSGNIFVDPSVGNVITDSTNPAVNNPNIEGLYSADANFIVQSYTSGTNICNTDGTPLDKKLNVIGSIITNAAQAGGSFQDNRDLCVYDTSCAAVSVGDNSGGTALSYILTLFADGKFLNHKLYNWQELRP